MEIALEAGERIDSLHVGDFRIVQNRNFFCFGMDAVLLSDFAFSRIDFKAKNLKVLDLCSGNAIVPLLLCGKLKERDFRNHDFGNLEIQDFENHNVNFSALEIQEKIADMARRTVLLNNLQDKISVKNGDLCKIENLYDSDSFDAVTCNPPYILPSNGRQSANKAKMIARQEICCSLNDVLRAAFYVLKDGGSFFMVHRPERFDEIVSSLKSSGFGIKNFRLVKPFENENPKMVLFHCVAEKNFKSECQKNQNLQDEKNDENVWKNGKTENLKKIELPPLVIYKEKGVYTLETEKIYGRKANENF
ncbi:MAG: hypothetical protein SOT81_06455 [Treponema sp.]|nr:hypothetical protein [Treponema sp.]